LLYIGKVLKSVVHHILLQVNLSPALGNDCDVDNRVKRPLLHDMFDLLGLPMCNTGLSLFRMTCRSASGPRFGGDGRPTALAAAATEKWKSKRKTNSNNNNNNNNNSTANNNNNNNVNASKKDGTAVTSSTAQAQSSARQSTLYGPGKQRGAATAADLCNSPLSSPVWGNGRDWSRPADSEGDWVRVFPFAPSPRQLSRTGTRPPPSQQQPFGRRSASSSSPPSDTGSARATVKTIQEYLKCCKKVARSCEGLSVVPDEELNDKLRDLFPAATNTWLPPL